MVKSIAPVFTNPLTIRDNKKRQQNYQKRIGKFSMHLI
jgi:hypothetical protein